MTIIIKEIKIETTHPIQIIDITDRVSSLVKGSGVKDGGVTVITQHTTTAININEREEGLQRDMVDFLTRQVPKGGDFIHNRNAADGRPNAHSHLLTLFSNASETVPVSDGKMLLGGRQSIFFIELDGPREERTFIVQIKGE